FAVMGRQYVYAEPVNPCRRSLSDFFLQIQLPPIGLGSATPGQRAIAEKSAVCGISAVLTVGVKVFSRVVVRAGIQVIDRYRVGREIVREHQSRRAERPLVERLVGTRVLA